MAITTDRENNWIDTLIALTAIWSPSNAIALHNFLSDNHAEDAPVVEPEVEVTAPEAIQADPALTAESIVMDAEAAATSPDGQIIQTSVVGDADLLTSDTPTGIDEAPSDDFWTSAGELYGFDGSYLALHDDEDIDDAEMSNSGSAFGASYLSAAAVLYEERHGEPPPDSMSNEDLALWAERRVSWFNNNIGSVSAAALSGSTRENAALMYLVDMNDRTEWTWSDVRMGAGRMLADPTNIVTGVAAALSFGAGGAAVEAAKQAARMAIREGVEFGVRQATRQAVRTAVVQSARMGVMTGAFEGGLGGAADSAGRQSIEMQIERQESFSIGRLAFDTGLGIGAGALLGGTLNAGMTRLGATELGVRLSSRVSSVWNGVLGRAPADVELTPTNIPRVARDEPTLSSTPSEAAVNTGVLGPAPDETPAAPVTAERPSQAEVDAYLHGMGIGGDDMFGVPGGVAFMNNETGRLGNLGRGPEPTRTAPGEPSGAANGGGAADGAAPDVNGTTTLTPEQQGAITQANRFSHDIAAALRQARADADTGSNDAALSGLREALDAISGRIGRARNIRNHPDADIIRTLDREIDFALASLRHDIHRTPLPEGHPDLGPIAAAARTQEPRPANAAAAAADPNAAVASADAYQVARSEIDTILQVMRSDVAERINNPAGSAADVKAEIALIINDAMSQVRGTVDSANRLVHGGLLQADLTLLNQDIAGITGRQAEFIADAEARIDAQTTVFTTARADAMTEASQVLFLEAAETIRTTLSQARADLDALLANRGLSTAVAEDEALRIVNEARAAINNTITEANGRLEGGLDTVYNDRLQGIIDRYAGADGTLDHRLAQANEVFAWERMMDAAEADNIVFDTPTQSQRFRNIHEIGRVISNLRIRPRSAETARTTRDFAHNMARSYRSLISQALDAGDASYESTLITSIGDARNTLNILRARLTGDSSGIDIATSDIEAIRAVNDITGQMTPLQRQGILDDIARIEHLLDGIVDPNTNSVLISQADLRTRIAASEDRILARQSSTSGTLVTPLNFEDLLLAATDSRRAIGPMVRLAFERRVRHASNLGLDYDAARVLPIEHTNFEATGSKILRELLTRSNYQPGADYYAEGLPQFLFKQVYRHGMEEAHVFSILEMAMMRMGQEPGSRYDTGATAQDLVANFDSILDNYRRIGLEYLDNQGITDTRHFEAHVSRMRTEAQIIESNRVDNPKGARVATAAQHFDGGGFSRRDVRERLAQQLAIWNAYWQYKKTNGILNSAWTEDFITYFYKGNGDRHSFVRRRLNGAWGYWTGAMANEAETAAARNKGINYNISWHDRKSLDWGVPRYALTRAWNVVYRASLLDVPNRIQRLMPNIEQGRLADSGSWFWRRSLQAGTILGTGAAAEGIASLDEDLWWVAYAHPGAYLDNLYYTGWNVATAGFNYVSPEIVPDIPLAEGGFFSGLGVQEDESPEGAEDAEEEDEATQERRALITERLAAINITPSTDFPHFQIVLDAMVADTANITDEVIENDDQLRTAFDRLHAIEVEVEARAQRAIDAATGMQDWLLTNPATAETYNAMSDEQRLEFIDERIEPFVDLQTPDGDYLTVDQYADGDTLVVVDGEETTLGALYGDVQTALLLDRNNNGIPDELEPRGLGDIFNTDNLPDASLTWQETGEATQSMANFILDHDNDGVGMHIDTATGRAISGTIQGVWRAATNAHGDLSQTQNGRETLNGIYAGVGALFAPWILSRLPGFGWLNNRGIRTVVMILTGLLAWKWLNSGGLQGGGNNAPSTAADDDLIDAGDTDTDEGTAQGSGTFIQEGIINVRTQPHAGGLPQIITLEGDFDGDPETQEILNIMSLDRDEQFVAQVASADGSTNFVSTEILSGEALQGLLNLTPSAENRAIASGSPAGGRDISIEFITNEGETTPSSTILRIGEQEFTLGIEVEGELDNDRLHQIEVHADR